MEPLFTIGYEGATVPALLETLREARVELLVDIRAVANSRRPGFAKTALAANVVSRTNAKERPSRETAGLQSPKLVPPESVRRRTS